MTESRLQLLTRIFKLLAIATLLAGSSVISVAQSTRPPSPPTVIGDKNPGEPTDPIASLEAEMRAKREIRAADKAHRENLERAHELSMLSTSIGASFREKKQLDRGDLKKLDKVEKLAKSIRHAAGGSEDEFEIEQRPMELGAALTMLGEVSESLKSKVEKTPKHVVSAAVIDEANVLLELVRIVRTFADTRNH